mgnify:CR=1 FL=1
MRKITFLPGNIYHIYNRGVEKRNVFINDNDRWRFLQGLFLFNDINTSSKLLWELERLHGAANFKTLKEYFSENKNKYREPLIRIMADCLMPNHYHLLIEELKEGGITKFMHKFGTGYTMYFNKKYDRVGSLFQGPFKAVPVEEETHLEYLLVYVNVINPGQLIESNLKEEGIKNKKEIMNFAKSYLWSTHKEYLQTRDSIIIDKGLLGEIFPDGKKYEEFVESVLSEMEKFNNISHLFLE